MREVDELESIGDACYNMACVLDRQHESGKRFTDTQMSNLSRMMVLTDEALTQMNKVIRGRREEQNIQETFRIENDINMLRTQLRNENIEDIGKRSYSYLIGTQYLDFINECEKLGDYVVNVVQARLGC
jgi:phosphate:Na+ symporter